MAVFGAQLIITMIVASVVHKLSPYYSFGRWLVTRKLVYFTFVSNHSYNVENNPRAKGRKRSTNFHPDNRGSPAIVLKECSFTYLDLVVMHYSNELKWILDLLIATLVTIIGTAIYFCISPSSLISQMNLSAIWVGFLLFYTYVIMFHLMQIYLDPKLPKERMSQVLLTIFMIACLVIILVLDNSVFDFKLKDCLNELNTLIEKRFNLSSGNEAEYIPMWSLKAIIGVLASLIASVLVFPTLNYARLHFETLKSTKSFLWRCFQNVSFILPLICGSLWIKPSSKISILPIDPDKEDGGIRVDQYKALTILVCCLSRFFLFRSMMQTYLNRAKDYAGTGSTDEDGNNGEARIKHKITSVFIFYCCSAIQYLGPVILLMMFVFLYTISSGYFKLLGNNAYNDHDTVVSLMSLSVYRGVFSFLTWWLCFCMFLISSLGSVIHSFLQS